MGWAIDDTPVSTDLLGKIRPHLKSAQAVALESLWAEEQVPVAIVELCRLRIAQLHHNDGECSLRRQEAQLAGLTEKKIARLSCWYQDKFFTEGEKACIETAELFVQDPLAVTDALAAEVVELLGEPGYLALLEALALFDSMMRVNSILESVPDYAD